MTSHPICEDLPSPCLTVSQLDLQSVVVFIHCLNHPESQPQWLPCVTHGHMTWHEWVMVDDHPRESVPRMD